MFRTLLQISAGRLLRICEPITSVYNEFFPCLVTYSRLLDGFWLMALIHIVLFFSLQIILFSMCAGNELFYCTLYLTYFTAGPQGLLSL